MSARFKKNKRLHYAMVRQYALSMLAAVLVFIVSFYFVLVIITKSSTEQTYELIAENFSSLIAQDVLTGLDAEVYRKCNDLYSNDFVEMVSIRRMNASPDRNLCPQKNKNDIAGIEQSALYDLAVTKNIFFDSGKKEIAAHISIGFKGDGLKSSILLAIGTVLPITLVFIIVSMKVTYSRLKRLTAPFSEIADSLRSIDLDKNEVMVLPQYLQTECEESRMIYKSTNDLLEKLQHYKVSVAEKAQSDAIARMIQMLAHDVRAPFSMIRILMDILANAESARIPQIVRNFSPEIERSLSKVNGLIADVMEIGSPNSITAEDVSISGIIANNLDEQFGFSKESKILLQYEFNHISQVRANGLKLSRVFANLITNAVHAMKRSGTLTFATYETNSYVQVTIHNSDSFISEHDRTKLFDDFFTKGRSDGTGLGLAISKKIVSAVGGRIWCTSDEDLGTAFHFTLPVGESPDCDTIENLPSSASAVRDKCSKLLGQKMTDEDIAVVDLQQQIEKIIDPRHPISILICDDEWPYRNLIKKHLNGLADRIKCLEVSTTKAALKQCISEIEPNVLIMDVDFGDESNGNGITVLKTLRKLGSQARICVHSNRSVLDFSKESISAGADAFLPKPMAKLHLLQFILASLQDPLQSPNRSSLTSPAKVAVVKTDVHTGTY